MLPEIKKKTWQLIGFVQQKNVQKTRALWFLFFLFPFIWLPCSFTDQTSPQYILEHHKSIYRIQSLGVIL